MRKIIYLLLNYIVMIQKFFKRLSLWVILWSLCMWCFIGVTRADDWLQESDLKVNWFNILPELDKDEISKVETAIGTIWQSWWKVMENYVIEAEKLSTSQQIASWIMNWDTIYNYLVFVVQFLSQLWLVVWVVFIMYAGYMYMVSVFKWWKVPTETVKNAIIWVIIVIFSYAIMKTLTSFIGLS